jgi:hypothetical protein
MSAPTFTQEAMNIIKEIVVWFVDEEFAYIIIYGCEGAPHLLPRYFPNSLALREIAYQIISIDIATSMSRNQKTQWPTFPISLGIFNLLNAKHA